MRKTWMLLFLLATCTLIASPQVNAAILNVPADYATIQEAIDAAGYGDTIQVSAGQYNEEIILKSGVILQGAGAEGTIISGDGSGHVVTANDVDPHAKIDGFTITGGNASYGGGIYLEMSSLIISNNIISGNEATTNGGGIYCRENSSALISNNIITENNGGGICTSGSSPTISNNIISGNFSGGIYSGGKPSPTISNNIISGNTTYGIKIWGSSPTISHNIVSETRGAGIACYGYSSPIISYNTISNNHNDETGGGGIVITHAYNYIPIISNNLISGNTARYGAGMHFGYSSPTILNNTIVDNYAYWDGGGIVFDNGSPVIKNNIISGNTAATGIGGAIFFFAHSGAPIIDFNDVWGNSEPQYAQVSPGSNDISADPLFVEPVTGDYRLLCGSPCIDAGSNDAVPTWLTTDLEGDPRIFDGTSDGQLIVDMGADEINHLPPVADAGPDQTVDEGKPITLNGSGSYDPEGNPLTYSWHQIAGQEVILDLTTPEHPTFIAPLVDKGGETLTFMLTVSDGMCTSDTDTVDVTVKNVNHAPVPVVECPEKVNEGTSVTLIGEDSYDPDMDPFTYLWAQVGGIMVDFSDPTVANPSFTAPYVGPTGDTLSFTLTVDDEIASATSQPCEVIVENVNHCPIAEAGEEQTVDEGSLVTLDGTHCSDPDGDPLTFIWTQIPGPNVTLSDDSIPAPSFTAPVVDTGGDALVFSLTVEDGLCVSESDEVTISILDVNDPPRCELGKANPAVLWPPNHKLVEVQIINVTDPNDNQVTIAITDVTQDEPVNGVGDGDTSPDAMILGSKVLIRAERAGGGNGRIYHIGFSAFDNLGESCTGYVTVCVPHDRRSSPCVDDGKLFDSLSP